MERRFFNQSQPQTLQGAVFLLYANVVVALLFRTGGEGLFASAAGAVLRTTSQTTIFIGNLVAIAVVLGSVGAGYLIANEKKVGWRLGVMVAAVPVTSLVLLLLIGYPERLSIIDAVNLFGLKLLFDAALLVLLVHDQTRSYEKVWFK